MSQATSSNDPAPGVPASPWSHLVHAKLAAEAKLRTLTNDRAKYLETSRSANYKLRHKRAMEEYATLSASPDLRGTGIPDLDGPEKDKALVKYVNGRFKVDLMCLADKRACVEIKAIRSKIGAIHEEIRSLKNRVENQVYEPPVAQADDDYAAIADTFDVIGKTVVADAFEAESMWLRSSMSKAEFEINHKELLDQAQHEYDRLVERDAALAPLLAPMLSEVQCQMTLIKSRVDSEQAQARADVLNSWEELVADEANFQLDTLKNEEQLLLGKTQLVFPDFTESVSGESAYQIDANHPQLNASRIVTSMRLYINAAKSARAAFEANGRVGKPVVVDYGAGSFGASRLQFLRQGRGDKNKDVYLHACLPDTGGADVGRLGRFRKDPRFTSYNYVPETKMVVRDRLNYCHHLARDCDCMEYYSPGMRFPVAVHAAYYFNQADYDKILSYAPFLEAAVHIPRVGHSIPLDVPEYMWDDPTQTGPAGEPATFVERIGWKVRETLRGIGCVRMRPLRMGGTSYEHEDISRYIVAGGYHSYPINDALEDVTQGDWKTAAWGCTIFAASATATYLTCPGSTVVVKAATALLSGAQALGMAVAATMFNNRRKFWTRPCPDARHTVHFHVKTSFSKKDSEPLVAILSINKQAPTRLIPKPIDSEQVDKEQVKKATAAIALGGDTPKTKMQMAARLCRDGLPIKRVKDTIVQAGRQIRFLAFAEPDPQPPPSFMKTYCAALSLPIACAASLKARSILDAALPTTGARFAARALYLGSVLTVMDIIHLSLLFLPMWVATAWLFTVLAARVFSA